MQYKGNHLHFHQEKQQNKLKKTNDNVEKNYSSWHHFFSAILKACAAYSYKNTFTAKKEKNTEDNYSSTERITLLRPVK